MTPVTPSSVCDMQAFDEAVAAELPCVSVVPYNSYEICKWFAANVRERLRAALAERTQQEAPRFTAYETNILNGVADWLETRSTMVWAKDSYSGLMVAWSRELRDILARPTSAANSTAPMQPSDGWHDPKLPEHGLMPFSFIGLSEHAKEAAREYAELYARKALAAPTQAAGGEATTYVACRECSNCGHVGINDDDGKAAACNTCEWSGPSPRKDHCPGCDSDGTMTSACPECGCRTTLIAEARIAAPASQAAGGEVVPAGYFLRDEQTGYWRQVQDHMSDYPGVIALYAAAPAAAVGLNAHADHCYKCGIARGNGRQLYCVKCFPTAAVPEGLTAEKLIAAATNWGLAWKADGCQKLSISDGNMGRFIAALNATPDAKTAEARKPLTVAEIDKLLTDLDNIAREEDKHREYGLQIGDPEIMERMRSAVLAIEREHGIGDQP